MSEAFKHRIQSSLVLWALLLISIGTGKAVLYVAIITLICGLGYWEYFQLYKRESVQIGGFIGTLVHLGYPLSLGAFYVLETAPGVGALLPPEDFDTIALLVVFFLFFVQRMRNKHRADQSYGTVTANFFAFIHSTFLFCFTLKLLFLFPGDSRSETSGIWYVFWFVLVTKFTDMGALFAGKLFGKTLVWDAISPSKTLQGLFGGVGLGVAAGVVDYLLFPERLQLFDNVLNVVFVSLLICLAAIYGDLAESIFKRSLKAKDSSLVIPGIGGVLDLMDSLCFSAPVMFFVAKYYLIP